MIFNSENVLQMIFIIKMHCKGFYYKMHWKWFLSYKYIAIFFTIKMHWKWFLL